MINSKELLFVVDENDNPLSPLPRDYVHKNKVWHRTTGIWIMNTNGQILGQKRSLKKDIRPGYWEAFFGGHVLAGQSYMETAVSEVREELGINVDIKQLVPYKIFKSYTSDTDFHQVFGLVIEESSQFNLEEEEIDEVAWKNIEKIRNILLIQNDPQWVHEPWDEEVLNWLDTMRK